MERIELAKDELVNALVEKFQADMKAEERKQGRGRRRKRAVVPIRTGDEAEAAGRKAYEDAAQGRGTR